MSGTRWDRVQDLYHEALARPVDTRAQFLGDACAGDTALLAEVQSLLDQPVSDEQFLTASAHDIPHVHRGQRLSSYEIDKLIGRGGMGEVYKARDTKLGRDVAIKVLPRVFTSDAHRLARFEREARLLASLNHPHIGAIYGTVETDGVRGLVLELVEGATLADRVAKGPVPAVEVVAIARQIADALEAAHDKGIVHRDLKPANIKVTPGGHVKVLDFGLAKVFEAGDSGAGDASITEASGTAFRERALIGTPAYMSPEQARGQAIDKRTDIWAFGCVLYELLTGRAAFPGRTVSDTVAKILEGEPDWNALPASVPVGLIRLLRHCLQKDPRKRLRDIGDAHVYFDAHEERKKPARQYAWKSMLAGAALAGLASAIAIGMTPRSLPGTDTGQAVVRFSIPAPRGTRFPRGMAEMALSPNGDRIAFVALSEDSRRRLWIRRFDSVDSEMVHGSEGATYPFWSPDARWIGFAANGQLKRVEAAGGAVQVICNDVPPSGSTWSADGVILHGSTHGIQSITISTCARSQVTTPDRSRGETLHTWPTFLPDGRRFLYLARSGRRENTGIYQGSLDGGAPVRLMGDDSPTALASAHLLSVDASGLWARAYDRDEPDKIGEPRRVHEGVGYMSQRAEAAFSAAGGTLAYRDATRNSRLAWFDRSGTQVGEFELRSDYEHPTLSPDNRYLAVERTDPETGRHGVWVFDVKSGTTMRLTLDRAGAHMPTWSFDGRRVLFTSSRNGGNDFYTRASDGAGADSLVLRAPSPNILSHWSADGRLIAFTGLVDQQRDLWQFPVASGSDGKPLQLTDTPWNELQPQYSPDSRWVAYTSDQSGAWEVYLRQLADGTTTRVSQKSGTQPQWRADGRELFYLTLGGEMMAVDIFLAGAGAKIGIPKRLFGTNITTELIDRRNHYAVSADGRRFLVVVSPEEEAPSPITVVLNWPAMLAAQR